MSLHSFRFRSFACYVVVANWACVSCAWDNPGEAATPQRRAIDFLAAQVPRWPRENKCFSCHNNGDAARALYVAQSLGMHVAAGALNETTDWLRQPKRWEHNGGEGEFNDKQLAAIQFAFALSEATRAGSIDELGPLIAAARKVSDFQKPDGSWQTVPDGTIGSPITYGNVLATVIARRTLIEAGRDRFAEPVAKAEAWLAKRSPQSVLDSAALLLAFPHTSDRSLLKLHDNSLDVIRSGQNADGGWSPYVNSRSEPFDTAIVLLALCGITEKSELARPIAAGRDFLIASQQADGSWLETTRPANDASYAHQISTSGWAALALLSAQKKPDD